MIPGSPAKFKQRKSEKMDAVYHNSNRSATEGIPKVTGSSGLVLVNPKIPDKSYEPQKNPVES